MRWKLYTYSLLLGFCALARDGVASNDPREEYTPDDSTVTLLQLNTGLQPSRILSAVDCVRVLAMHDSNVSGLEGELRRYGLWDRTEILRAQPDPDGSEAGCFRAHVHAWEDGYDAGCSNMLVLEEDAAFYNVTVHESAARADKLVASGVSYDLIFLGWSGHASVLGAGFSLRQVTDAECAFEINGRYQTHAYIISSETMKNWRHWQYSKSDPNIDRLLNKRQREGRYFTVRPASFYQSCHETSIPWNDSKMTIPYVGPYVTIPDAAYKKAHDWQGNMQAAMCHPEVAFGHQDQMYARFGYSTTCV
eukprot:TRINITY_DN7452_c0_g1_i1.p1 TRINITY_DN7452_c0_g1~~TRINITY_DN7452_c0_g1_i1.p1  ORF type:complete len:324 (-),score=45.39 TRINITY_DN7452_c0_g1_i1:173-1090(-)